MIGVCIKYFHENYGGMLQAYATASMLEQRGLAYELIQYEKVRTIPGMVRSMPRLLNRVLLNDKYEAFLKKQGLKAHPEFAEMDKIRMQSFRRFKESHFTRLSPVFKGYGALCEGARRYSAVVTGSDQLWSPSGIETGFYNLTFVREGIPRLSYAASIGVSQVDKKLHATYQAFLSRMTHISMREKRGQELVMELKEKYTIVMVTHNMQQAVRVSDHTAFFLLGELVEFGKTDDIFSQPKDQRTEDYITGRFG